MVERSGFKSGALAIVGTGPDDVWLGRPTGDLEHFDGNTWTSSFPHARETMTWLPLLWQSDDGRVWALSKGDSGTSIFVVTPDNENWELVYDGPAVHLRSLHASYEDNIWAVGAGAAVHYDGTRWSQRDDAPQGASAVHVGGRSDVWFAGRHGSLGRFDGARWHRLMGEFHVYSAPQHTRLSARADDIYLAGSELWHGDGEQWQVVEPFALDKSRVRRLTDVWCGTGEQWVVQVDDAGPDLVWRRQDHGDWVVMLEREGARVVWGSGPGEVYVAGRPFYDQLGPNFGQWTNTMHRWDGAEWRHIPVNTPFPVDGAYSNPPSFTDIHGSGPGHVVFIGSVPVMDGAASGSRGFFAVTDGDRFAVRGIDHHVNDPTYRELLGLYVRGRDDLWAVGGNHIYHYDGDVVTRERLSEGDSYLRTIAPTLDGGLLVGGFSNQAFGTATLLFRFEDNAWHREAAATSQGINDLWMSPSGHALAVGYGPAIAHYDN